MAHTLYHLTLRGCRWGVTASWGNLGHYPAPGSSLFLLYITPPQSLPRAASTAKSRLQEPGGLGRLQDQEYGGAHTRSALPTPILQQSLEAARERERDRRLPAEVHMPTCLQQTHPTLILGPTNQSGAWLLDLWGAGHMSHFRLSALSS